MKKATFCFLLCFAFLITSCSSSLTELSEGGHSLPTENPIEQSLTSFPQEASQTGVSEFEEEIAIDMFYHLSREEFQSFVKNISRDSFPWDAVSYNLNDVTLEPPVLLRWEQFAQEFSCTKSSFANFLFEKGIRQELEEITLFMTYEGLPIAWLQAQDKSFFLSGTFESGDLTFILSEESAFQSFFLEKECKVYVNGEEIVSAVPAVMHGFSADIPMLAILQKFGANVAWESTSKALVRFNDETYCLNMELVTFGIEGDLLADCRVSGGYSIVYPVDGDVMVSHTALLTLLDEMGIDCSVSMQNEEALVEYFLRKTGTSA